MRDDDETSASSTASARAARPVRASKARRLVRALLAIVAWIAIALGALVASALAHLDSPVARRATCEELRRQLDASLAGSFELDRCETLSLREVKIEGFRVRAPDGTQVLDVRSAKVHPSVRASLGGVPTIRRVVVDVTSLDLRDPAAIGEAFAAKVPSPASLEPTVLPRIEIEQVELHVARLRLPEDLTLEELALRTSVSLGPAVLARDLTITGAARRGDAEALSLAIEGDADLGAEATSTLTLELARPSRVGPRDTAANDTASDDPRDGTETRVTLDARMRWGETLDAGPVHLDATTTVALAPEGLRELGVPELAGLLGGPLRLELSAAGWLDAFHAEGTLHAGEERVALAADLDGAALRARVATEGITLASLVGTLPVATFAGEVELTTEPEGDARALSLRASDLRYDRWTVPQVEADALLRADDVLELRRVALPHLAHDGRLDVTGTIGETIDLRFDVDVPSIARDANVRALAPGVDARLVGRGRFALADERVDLELALDAHDVNGGAADVRARELSVRGYARGALTRPNVRLTLGGADVRVAGQTLERVDARVVGGPEGGVGRYALSLDIEDRDETSNRRARAALTVAVRGTRALEARISGEVEAEGVWPSRLHARLSDVRVGSDGRVAIGDLRVADRGGALLVELGGTLAARGRSDVHALVDVELAAIEQAFGLAEGLRGRVHVEGAMQGSLAAPELLVSATATELAIRDLPSSSARIEASVTPGVGATLSAELRGAGSLDVDATLRSDQRTLARLTEGELDARVRADSLSLALLDLVVPDAPALEGTLDLEASARGTRDAPSIAIALRGHEVVLEGGDPFDPSLNASWNGEAVEATLGASDGVGPFLAVTARMPLRRDELDTLPDDAEAWTRRSFAVDVDVPTRALPRLPRPFAQAVPIEAGVHVELRGEDGAPTVRGRVAGRFLETTRVGACGDARPSFGAQIDLRGERAQVLATLRDAGGEARLDARAAVPWRAWLRDGFEAPTVDATIASEALALERLPYACESLTGVARLDVRATGLLGDSPNVRADVDVRELRAAQSPAVDATIDAELDATHGTVRVATFERDPSPRGESRSAGEGSAVARRSTTPSVAIEGAWDWRWAGLEAPELDDMPWRASARFDHAAIAPLVAMVPQLADPSGSIDGTVRAAGRGFEATPDVEGRLALRGVGLTLRDPFVRVAGVQGGIALRDGAIVIDDLRYRDLDGRLRVDGRVGLAGLAPSAIDLRVRARDLPARVEGVIFAYVSADVRVEGDLAARDRRVLDVTLEELAVRVPEESGRNVQSLERHPDVTYVDALPGGLGALVASAEDPDDPEASTDEAPTEPPVPIVVRVRSTPFWVRRDDFAFQLDADVRSTSDVDGTRIEGPLNIRRGYIELLGKRFELQPGEIRFSGGSSVDPRLDLTALHTLRTGERVFVDIGGYLSAPTLAFRSPDVEGGDERAVIDLLVRGGAQRDASVTARDQATSMLAGMLAGFLSSMTRRELGAFLPVFRIEAEDARSARVRAGFQADRLIPSWLEGVVRGIYVEGFVGAEEQSGQARAAGGFLLELLFPYDLVGSGQWEQGNNWSLDLTWEPR